MRTFKMIFVCGIMALLPFSQAIGDTSSSDQISPGSVTSQTQSASGTIQTEVDINYPSDKTPPDDLTCPSGYVVTGVKFTKAKFYQPHGSTTCSTDKKATSCRDTCNYGCGWPISGLCCKGVPGYYGQNNDNCTTYTTTYTCDAAWVNSDTALGSQTGAGGHDTTTTEVYGVGTLICTPLSGWVNSP